MLVHNSGVRRDSQCDRWKPFDVGQVVSLLHTVPVRWWLSGGLALDQFLGFASREHRDIDVSVVRSDWAVLQAAVQPGLNIWTAHEGVLYTAGARGVDDQVHNLWARQGKQGPWRVQFNLEDVADGMWRYRRDSRIQLSLDELTWHSGQLRCIRPAVQMLWKAHTPTAKDERDYEAVVIRMNATDRLWLGEAIRLAHPLSPWAHRTELTAQCESG